MDSVSFASKAEGQKQRRYEKQLRRGVKVMAGAGKYHLVLIISSLATY